MPPVRGRARFRDWLRRHLALLLQLLSLGLLALALAAPSIRLPAGGSGLVVTVAQPGLDPAPLAMALAELGDRPHSLVLAQPQPRLAVSDSDPDAVLAALAEVPDSHGGGDLTAALNLAAGLMTGQPGARGLVLAMSANGLPPDPRWTVLAAEPARFRLGPLVMAPAADGSSLLYHLQGPPESDFELLLEAADWAVAALATAPSPQARLVRSGRLPPSGKLSGLLAGLPADVGVRIWVGQPGSGQYVTEAAGPASPARGRVYVAAANPDPYQRAARAAGHQVSLSPDEGFDIVVYVNQLPEQLPAAGIVLVNPPDGPGLLARAEPSFDLALADSTGSLLTDIAAAGLAPGAVRALRAPVVARSHADSGSGSWLWQARLAGRELVALAIDPALGLSGQAAFPLLVRDLLAQVDPLRPLNDPAAVRAGVATALRPHPRAQALAVTDPAGEIELAADTVPAQAVRPDTIDQQSRRDGIYWRPRQTGLYWIEQEADGATILRTPVWVQAVGPAMTPNAWTVPINDTATARLLQLWPLLAGLAAIALLSEWVWFNRRRGAF